MECGWYDQNVTACSSSSPATRSSGAARPLTTNRHKLLAVQNAIDYKFKDSELLWDALHAPLVEFDNEGAVKPSENARKVASGQALAFLTFLRHWYNYLRRLPLSE